MSGLENEFIDTTSKFRFKRITPNCNHYAIFPDPTVYAYNAITMTGGAVTNQISIPFAHRINRIEFCHLDGTLALNTDNLIVLFTSKSGEHNFLSKYESCLLSKTFAVSTAIESFGEGYEFEQRTWTLSMNSTNAHLVIPVIYVQIVGSSGYQ